MTKLHKPVKRSGCGLIREAGQLRNIVVILRPPNVIGFRTAGCRKEYQLTTQACYTMAVRAHVATEKKEKAKQRKLKQKGKRK